MKKVLGWAIFLAVAGQILMTVDNLTVRTLRVLCSPAEYCRYGSPRCEGGLAVPVPRKRASLPVSLLSG